MGTQYSVASNQTCSSVQTIKSCCVVLPEGHRTWEYKENFWRGKTGQSLRNMAFSVYGQTFNDGESSQEIFRFTLVFFQTLAEDTITGPFYFLLCRTFMEFIVFLFLTLDTNVLFFFNLNQLTSKASNSFFATLSEITLTDCVGCIFQYLFLFFLQYPVINIIRRSRTDCVYFLLL